jgi:ribosome-binding ATPase YchF (GTP1/OBG family)
MKKILIAVAAVAAIGAAGTTLAQTAPNSRDQTELLVSQIQTDKRAVVLAAMNMSDAEVATFTPIYDAYQAEMKDIFTRGTDVLNKFASNYETMTDDAAKSILKDFFKVRDDRNAMVKKYAKKMEKELPATTVLRWVQVENKLNALLDYEAARIVPLS